MVRPLPGGGENEVSSITAEKVYGSNISTLNFVNIQKVSSIFMLQYVCSLSLRWGL